MKRMSASTVPAGSVPFMPPPIAEPSKGRGSCFVEVGTGTSVESYPRSDPATVRRPLRWRPSGRLSTNSNQDLCNSSGGDDRGPIGCSPGVWVDASGGKEINLPGDRGQGTLRLPLEPPWPAGRCGTRRARRDLARCGGAGSPNCGSPEIVEGSLCRFSGEGGGLVGDRWQPAG